MIHPQSFIKKKNICYAISYNLDGVWFFVFGIFFNDHFDFEF
jgi:hypothetical protein